MFDRRREEASEDCPPALLGGDTIHTNGQQQLLPVTSTTTTTANNGGNDENSNVNGVVGGSSSLTSSSASLSAAATQEEEKLFTPVVKAIEPTECFHVTTQHIDGRYNEWTHTIGWMVTSGFILFPVGVYYGCFFRQNCEKNSFTNYSTGAFIASLVSVVIVTLLVICVFWSYFKVATTPPGPPPTFLRRSYFEETVKRAIILDCRKKELDTLISLHEQMRSQEEREAGRQQQQERPPIVSLETLALMEFDPEAPCVPLQNLSLESERGVALGGQIDWDNPRAKIYQKLIRPKYYALLRSGIVNTNNSTTNQQAIPPAPPARPTARQLLEAAYVDPKLFSKNNDKKKNDNNGPNNSASNPYTYSPDGGGNSDPSAINEEDGAFLYYSTDLKAINLLSSVGSHACVPCESIEGSEAYQACTKRGMSRLFYTKDVAIAGTSTMDKAFEKASRQHREQQQQNVSNNGSNNLPLAATSSSPSSPSALFAGSVIKWGLVHHCSTCHQCVLALDHHCPWVGQCIGRSNHKFFILFLFYTSIAAAAAMVSMGRDIFSGKGSVLVGIGVVSVSEDDGGPRTNACTWLMTIAFIVEGLFFLMLFPFFWSSLNAAMVGDTKLERMIRMRKQQQQGQRQDEGGVSVASPNNSNGNAAFSADASMGERCVGGAQQASRQRRPLGTIKPDEMVNTVLEFKQRGGVWAGVGGGGNGDTSAGTYQLQVDAATNGDENCHFSSSSSPDDTPGTWQYNLATIFGPSRLQWGGGGEGTATMQRRNRGNFGNDDAAEREYLSANAASSSSSSCLSSFLGKLAWCIPLDPILDYRREYLLWRRVVSENVHERLSPKR